MSTRRVHSSLFWSNHEIIDVIRHETEACRRHLLALLMLKRHHFISTVNAVRFKEAARDWGSVCVVWGVYVELDGVLRLWQHIEWPRTHLSVSRHRHQVVSILRSYHLHAIHRMLEEDKIQYTPYILSVTSYPTSVFLCTVWAEAERGVRWTGVRLLLRLSHKTICPE